MQLYTIALMLFWFYPSICQALNIKKNNNISLRETIKQKTVLQKIEQLLHYSYFKYVSTHVSICFIRTK